VKAWLDLAALVRSSRRHFSAALTPGGGAQVTSGKRPAGDDEFAAAVGDAYLDIRGWHLTLRDAKLHLAVAAALAREAPCTEASLRALLARVPVDLGGGPDKGGTFPGGERRRRTQATQASAVASLLLL